jgi:ABC-type nitrate/sulfonate/bicarbonate transport system substrate-binding protein
MTFHPRKFLLSATLLAALSGSAFAAEEVKFRYLASQGGLSAHELAAELGYFDGTGITIENVG